MIQKIKEDIISVLKKAIPALKKEDASELSSISNQTVHDSSVFQDDHAITIAVLIYTISKICQYCKEKEIDIPNILPILQDALENLKKDNIKLYENNIKDIFKLIKKSDKKTNIYIEEAINRAKIKKASGIHAHGISIPQTAELLGISQWDLRNYIGITKVPDKNLGGIKEHKRLETARRLFS